MTDTLASTPTGVTAPQGFRAAAVAAGLKTSGLLDLALVVNDGPKKAAAGTFTANRVKAAPVLWTQQVVRDGRVDAVVLNSGGANACTGAEGFQDTHATAEFAALALDVSATDIAICSTGLIGERLPMNAVLTGVDEAVPLLSATGGDDAARAIMTTDSVPKQSVVEGNGFTVGGMAKGAGMLAPGLATMLCVVTTDADVDADTLDRVLRSATSRTFDRVDSDGCMSTNDTVLLLASGASGTQPSEDDLGQAVLDVCADLARQLVDDAEGASKTISVQVIRAVSEQEATDVARAVARSNLLKCALHGEDPNWGRVLAAVGTTDAVFEPQRLAVSLGGVWVCRDGAAAEDRSKVDLSGRLVPIVVDLGAGDAESTVWTNDLTAAYVHENSAYST
ncbi:MAG: glutamate N-acetyltransferase / amino-acid N-acetyltransferase [Actinomycetota bacterium]|jgi:glutamate N-acetyltransferase/amino-acid N-acetyltransferase|nr:glutamate N-acetyltransferase / amino-acid N-acetyltransferase [Actinomycetota bacterium]MDQ1669997.1 glutamate N-acetyltransferase / amino-acid N-acetyltransferase [Actinomycetota bacterium]